MTYRIFTNDRGTVGEIPIYSALKEVDASGPEEALKHCPPQFNFPHYAQAVAIRYPERFQSDDEKLWLKKHVYLGD